MGFFSQHAEKIILAAGFSFLVAVVFFRVLSPTQVELMNREAGPEDVAEGIKEAAKKLDMKLNDDKTTIPDLSIPKYTETFVKRSSVSVELEPLLPLGDSGLARKDFSDGMQEDVAPYYLARPPMPTDLKVRSGHYVMGDFPHRSDRQPFIQLIGDRRPADFNAVTAVATFDTEEWERRVSAEPPSAALRKLPGRYWRSTRQLTAVFLLRQQLDPVTGEWGEAIIIDSLPNQIAFLPQEEFGHGSGDATAVLGLVRESQDLIARAEFPPVFNKEWIPPTQDSRVLTAEDYKKLNKISKDISRIRKQIETQEVGLEKAMEQEQQRSERGTRRERVRSRGTATPSRAVGGSVSGGDLLGGSGPPGGMGGFGPSSGGLSGQAARPRSRRSSVSGRVSREEQLRDLYEKLDKAEIERDELIGVKRDVTHRSRNKRRGRTWQDSLMGMGPGGGMDGMGPPGGGMGGFGPPGGMGGFGPPGGMMGPAGGGSSYTGRRPQGSMEGLAIEEISRKITVWAHDLSVKPGQTYRYRLIVSVINPLFRQRRVAPEQRAEHFNRMALGPDPYELAESPWSDPVKIDPEYYFFLVSGNPTNREAQVEVWHVHDGRWRDGRFKVYPGDPIGGQITITTASGDRNLDMRVGSLVVDIAAESGTGSRSGAKLLYVKPGAGRIASRTVDQDSNCEDRIRLRAEKEMEELEVGVEEELARLE